MSKPGLDLVGVMIFDSVCAHCQRERCAKLGMHMWLVPFSSNFRLKTTHITRKNARAVWRLTQRTLHTSRSNGSNTTPSPSTNSEPVNFEDLGLHLPIVSAMRRAFPNLARPTEAQATFIPAILNGKDILLRDSTGSGKCIRFLLTLPYATYKI
jgi:hypothetical protein